MKPLYQYEDHAPVSVLGSSLSHEVPGPAEGGSDHPSVTGFAGFVAVRHQAKPTWRKSWTPRLTVSHQSWRLVSKAAVFTAVLEQATEGITAAIRDGAAAAGSVGAWLCEFLAPAHLGRAHARATHGVLFAEAMSVTTEPRVREAIRRAHRVLAGTIAELLARGQAEGSVRRDLDSQAGAWWLLSLLASQGFRSAVMPDRRRLEAQLGALTLRALASDRDTKRGRQIHEMMSWRLVR